MIGVIVTFRYDTDFDAAKLQQVADGARARFVGMPGLRSKAFTIDAEQREAVNFYVWESEEKAKAFFGPELLERVTGLYGVRPTIRFVKLAGLVENTPA